MPTVTAPKIANVGPATGTNTVPSRGAQDDSAGSAPLAITAYPPATSAANPADTTHGSRSAVSPTIATGGATPPSSRNSGPAWSSLASQLVCPAFNANRKCDAPYFARVNSSHPANRTMAPPT